MKHYNSTCKFIESRETFRVKPLGPPDSHRLLAAQGWLELGNHLEANNELEEISPEKRAHPDVLEIRWEIYAREKKWPACVDIGLAIMKGDPHRSTGWLTTPLLCMN